MLSSGANVLLNILVLMHFLHVYNTPIFNSNLRRIQVSNNFHILFSAKDTKEISKARIKRNVRCTQSAVTIPWSAIKNETEFFVKGAE